MRVDTVLPDESRKKHAENQALGCGNFLRFAREASPSSGKQQVWMDRPFEALDGTVHHGFSLDSLAAVVDAYAGFYYGAGVRPEHVIGVYVDGGVANLIHSMALNAIGAVPAIVNGNMPVRIAARWFQKAGALGLFTDDTRWAIKEHLEGIPMPLFCLTHAGARAAYKPAFPENYPFRHAAADPILISHSSGTAGIPEAVVFRHGQFFHGIRSRLGLPFPKGSERMLSALPHSHPAGFAYFAVGVLSGCHMMILSSDKADAVLPAIQSFRPSLVVAFAETYVFLDDFPMGDYELSPIHLWYNVGQAAHQAHILPLVAKHPRYGRAPDPIRAGDGAACSLHTEEFLLKHFPEVADLSVVATHGGKFAEVTAIVRLQPEAKAAETKLLKLFNEKLQAGGKVELDAVLFAKPVGYTPSGSHHRPAHAHFREAV
jgi:acyl-CoA synthetase (AMP-forming)/AMP-acid ligase II